MRTLILSLTFDNLLGKEWSSVSKAAKDLVKKMLQKLPTNRISASEALADPWIKQFHKGGANGGLTPTGGAASGAGQKMGSPTQTVKPLCISALT